MRLPTNTSPLRLRQASCRHWGDREIVVTKGGGRAKPCGKSANLRMPPLWTNLDREQSPDRCRRALVRFPAFWDFSVHQLHRIGELEVVDLLSGGRAHHVHFRLGRGFVLRSDGEADRASLASRSWERPPLRLLARPRCRGRCPTPVSIVLKACNSAPSSGATLHPRRHAAE